MLLLNEFRKNVFLTNSNTIKVSAIFFGYVKQIIFVLE